MARKQTDEETPGTPPQEETEATTEDAGAENEGGGFSIEAIVRALPEGVCLCPTCLGMLGVVEDPPYDPQAHVCDVCRGHGELRTGSLVGGQGQRQCWRCGGVGWLPDEPGLPDSLPARAEFFDDPAVVPVDVAGRTPDDPAFDWSRVVPPHPPAPAAVLALDPPPPAPASS